MERKNARQRQTIAGLDFYRPHRFERRILKRWTRSIKKGQTLGFSIEHIG